MQTVKKGTHYGICNTKKNSNTKWHVKWTSKAATSPGFKITYTVQSRFSDIMNSLCNFATVFEKTKGI